MNLRKYREKVGFVRFYVIALVSLCLMFYAGYEFAHIENDNLRAQNRLLNKSLTNLTGVHQKLQSELNMLKVELEIAQLANEQSQANIKVGINREQTLKEQISFYQRVLAPEMSQDGFVVERMEVVPTLSENNFALNLILLQHENIKAVIKGTINIRVFGSENGKAASYNIVDLQDEPKSSLDFAFKYFQVLATSITLPESFTPDRFEISTDIYKYRKKRGSYSTVIKWQDALSE
ncbi:MAG: DUF6776 family protein [Glaciecola sp.]